MNKHFLILIILPFLTCCKQNIEVENHKENYEVNFKKDMTQISTYYLIRHAEKDQTDSKNEDPSLNAAGLKRAQRWASYFETIRIDEIYVTKYIRTTQTASMVAQQKALTPKLYDPHNIQLQEFLNTTRGKNVLIVGHNNTIPKFVNALIGKEEFGDMEDNDNSTLYKVVIDGDDKKVETLLVE